MSRYSSCLAIVCVAGDLQFFLKGISLLEEIKECKKIRQMLDIFVGKVCATGLIVKIIISGETQE